MVNKTSMNISSQQFVTSSHHYESSSLKKPPHMGLYYKLASVLLATFTVLVGVVFIIQTPAITPLAIQSAILLGVYALISLSVLFARYTCINFSEMMADSLVPVQRQVTTVCP